MSDPAQAPQPDVAEMDTQTSMLVDTPENAAPAKRAPRKRAPRKPKGDDAGADVTAQEAAPEQGDEPLPKAKPKPRAKAKPKDVSPPEAAAE